MGDDPIFNSDQDFESLNDKKFVFYGTDLLSPTDLAATEENIRSLVAEFQEKASTDLHAYCSSTIEHKVNGVLVAETVSEAVVVVQDQDVSPAVAEKLIEGEVVQVTTPDVNGDYTAGFKKGGMVAFSNCGPLKLF